MRTSLAITGILCARRRGKFRRGRRSGGPVRRRGGALRPPARDLAAEEFETFVEQFADHPRAGDARPPRPGLVKLKQFDAARQQYQRYLDNSPHGKHRPRAMFRLGEMSRLLGDHEAAESQLAEFCRLHPRHELTAVARAWATMTWPPHAGMPQRPIFRRCDAEPAGPRADACRFGLALALEELNHKEQALTIYQALAGKPSCPVADKAGFHLGRRHYLDGDYAAAMLEFAKLRTDFPESPWKDAATLGQARAELKLGDDDTAVANCASCSVVRKSARSCALRLGLLHKQHERGQDAADVLVAAADKQPDHPLAPYSGFHAGDALLLLNQAAAADGRFQAVFSTQSEHELADDALLGRVKAAMLAEKHADVDVHAADFVEIPRLAAAPRSHPLSSAILAPTSGVRRRRRVDKALYRARCGRGSDAGRAASLGTRGDRLVAIPGVARCVGSRVRRPQKVSCCTMRS